MGIRERLSRHTPAPSGRIVNLSRRRFLQGAGGLVLGLYFAPLSSPQSNAVAAGAATGAHFEPNAFVRIAADGRVTVLSKHVEMGQGSYTGLATLLAEELDADWSQVVVEGAPADAKRYANLLFGIQATGGSSAMANAWMQMREAGAAARAMLVAAAAERWQVPAAELQVDAGVIRHPSSQRSAGFGELVADAARQPVPAEIRVKEAKDFRLIGKLDLRRKDSAGKTDGSARFTQDVQLPGMLVAVTARPPRFGAKVQRFDASRALAVPGVVGVVAFDASAARGANAVAVLANSTWAAWQGRDALDVSWDESQAFRLGSDEIIARYRELAMQPGVPARQDGDAVTTIDMAARTLEAEYVFPYLAHAAMEPMNCVVRLSPQHCEIWNGEQWHTMDQATAAKMCGLTPDQVTITQLYAGGGFGRRANPTSDYVAEAVAIALAARAHGFEAPVKMVWTREDDMHAGHFRPLYLHRARLGFDAAGQLLAWEQRIVGQSILHGTAFESVMVKDGIDATSVEGAADLAYAVPALRVELHTPSDITVPVQWWRSVGHSHTAFVTETLIDEAAAVAGADPVAFRRGLLAERPRHRGVLDLVAQRAGWETPLASAAAGERRGRGVAVHESFNTYVAQVVELTVATDGRYRIDRVVCAVDCGLAINPDVIKAQMEGGIGFALAMALHGAITLKAGVVEQSNFDSYPVLRINEMPVVEVHIVPSAEKPSGVGEPGVPPLAPALANALFAATGQRLRSLPLPAALRLDDA